MALTITERLRWSEGGKGFRNYEIVHDGTVVTIDAKDMDLCYIEAIIAHSVYQSMAAIASNILGLMRVSISADHTNITWAKADANAVSHLTVAGW